MQRPDPGRLSSFAILALLVCMSACAKRVPAPGPTTSPRILETREGLASYYGEAFHGRITASGRPFDMNAMVAAHPRYPFGTLLRVTNLTNGRSAQVRILDRGPARRPQAEGVIIDLSRRAAEVLGFIRQGRARIRLEVLEWGST
jgi:rare lipoprotein A